MGRTRWGAGGAVRTPLTRALSHCGSPPQAEQAPRFRSAKVPSQKISKSKSTAFFTRLHLPQTSSIHPISARLPPTDEHTDDLPLRHRVSFVDCLFEHERDFVWRYCSAGWVLFPRLVDPGHCPARAWRVRGGRRRLERDGRLTCSQGLLRDDAFSGLMNLIPSRMHYTEDDDGQVRATPPPP